MDMLKSTLVSAVRAGAEEILRYFNGTFSISKKEGINNLVTEADHASEKAILSVIRSAFPDHQVLAEETGELVQDSTYKWIIDPIDGTVNYLYGIPQYAVSIAAVVEGRVVAGVVHNPAGAETWTATRGGGAALNGRPVRESGCDRLDRALVATGFGYDPRRRARQADLLRNVVPYVRDIRRAGAASLDLCAVATGRVDAYYERGLMAWDLAAGGLIAEEAGAVVAGLRGAAAGEDLVIAAGPALFTELHDLLEPLAPDRDG